MHTVNLGAVGLIVITCLIAMVSVLYSAFGQAAVPRKSNIPWHANNNMNVPWEGKFRCSEFVLCEIVFWIMLMTVLGIAWLPQLLGPLTVNFADNTVGHTYWWVDDSEYSHAEKTNGSTPVYTLSIATNKSEFSLSTLSTSCYFVVSQHCVCQWSSVTEHLHKRCR